MNIFDIINVPLGYLIKFCYMLVPNYAVALLLFAVIIKAVLFPLSIKQQKNMVKQAQLKPKETAIRKKYAGRTDKATQQKVQEEVMKLYQQENFNPMGGCLPLLVELPVVFALFNVINNPLKYLSGLADYVEPIKEKIAELGFEAATQIQMISVMKSNFPSFSDVLPTGFEIGSLPNFTIFGGLMDVSQSPSFSTPNLLLIVPVIVFFSYFFSMKLTKKFSYTPEQTGDAAKSMKIMDYAMPLMSVFFTFSMPAVIGIYWVYQSIITIARQYILSRMYPFPKFTEEDFKQAEREMNGKISKKEKKMLNTGTKPRSLHYIDDEEDTNESDEEETPKLSEPDEQQDTGIVKKAELKDDSDRHKK